MRRIYVAIAHGRGPRLASSTPTVAELQGKKRIGKHEHMIDVSLQRQGKLLCIAHTAEINEAKRALEERVPVNQERRQLQMSGAASELPAFSDPYEEQKQPRMKFKLQNRPLKHPGKKVTLRNTEIGEVSGVFGGLGPSIDRHQLTQEPIRKQIEMIWSQIGNTKETNSERKKRVDSLKTGVKQVRWGDQRVRREGEVLLLLEMRISVLMRCRCVVYGRSLS